MYDNNALETHYDESPVSSVICNDNSSSLESLEPGEFTLEPQNRFDSTFVRSVEID